MRAPGSRATAAPLQAVGDHTSQQPLKPFEDDDEDEYDFGVPPATFRIGRNSPFRYKLKYCFKLLVRLNRMDP